MYKLLKILFLPFYLCALILSFLLPFVIFNMLNEGSENYITATILIGAYPMMLTVTNGALIENFIMRNAITSSHSKAYIDDITNSTYMYWINVIFFSSDYLLKFLKWQRNELSQEVIEKGQKLAKRHNVLSLLSFLGVVLMLVVGVGDAYLSNT